MKFLLRQLFYILLFLAPTQGSWAASIVYNANKTLITGITDISIDTYPGQYKATFVDAFDTSLLRGSLFAQRAAKALRNLVISGGEFSGEDFDLIRDTRVVGLDDFPTHYDIYATPYNLHTGLVSYGSFRNYYGGSDASDQSGTFTHYLPLATPRLTWVKWEEVSPVPTPIASILFLPALIGFVSYRKAKFSI